MQQSRDGRWQARARVRDGRVREVSATADSKGAARRALVRRLGARRDPGTTGVTTEMTVETLASFWLTHRQTHGRAGQAGRLRPSTMGAYDAVLRTVVVPALGGFRVGELTVGVLEAAFADIEASGRSTVQARSVLSQMLGLAARHGAIQASPMPLVEKPARAAREVQALDVEAARRLRRVVDPDHRRTPGHRGPNHDLADLVDVLLGTGMRIGEVLALRWQDLDLFGDPPTVHVSGTLLEPRRGHVATLTRQEGAKSGHDRTLILPAAVVDVLEARRRGTTWRRLDDPVFASRTGTWLGPTTSTPGSGRPSPASAIWRARRRTPCVAPSAPSWPTRRAWTQPANSWGTRTRASRISATSPRAASHPICGPCWTDSSSPRVPPVRRATRRCLALPEVSPEYPRNRRGPGPKGRVP